MVNATRGGVHLSERFDRCARSHRAATASDPADDLNAVSLVTPPAVVPDPPPFSVDEATRFYCRAAETCFVTMAARWRLVPEEHRAEILARLPAGVAAYHEVNDDMTADDFAWATCGHGPSFRRGLCRTCHRKLGEADAIDSEDGRLQENPTRGITEAARRLSSASPERMDALAGRMRPDARERLREALERASGKGRG
jgi:hypothetical protein